ncbi:MAG: hypothetical protein AAGA56_05225 [Myxococcota bacterium]
MSRFLFLQNTVALAKSIAVPPPPFEITVVPQYAFNATHLVGAAGVLFCQHLDERHLAEHRSVWAAYLADGGTLALNGPVARPFVDGLVAAYRPVGGDVAGWLLDLAAPHPIFAGVTAADISWRRGVVGFWARGCFAPPDDAEVLTRFRASGEPADWTWSPPGGGRLFVHPGNNVWGFSREPSSAARVYPQLLQWMASP